VTDAVWVWGGWEQSQTFYQLARLKFPYKRCLVPEENQDTVGSYDGISWWAGAGSLQNTVSIAMLFVIGVLSLASTNRYRVDLTPEPAQGDVDQLPVQRQAWDANSAIPDKELCAPAPTLR
jgi:hypothetical protein